MGCRGTRTARKTDMIHNAWMPTISVDPQTYEVRADGELLTCQPAEVLQDVGDDLADATDSVIGEYFSIGPVIYVDQGARVTVMVDRDLEIF